MTESGSFVAWVDYSPAERDRMRQAIALFKETDTRDELGLGAIRDALADLMFPGTSTIQTRLRYFLFVPWLYQELERKRGVNSANVARHLRKHELALIEPLKASDTEGVFGAVSGPTVQRLPSDVYWNGLRTWGMFRRDLSREEFHRRWDELGNEGRHVLAPDDTGIRPDDGDRWDRHMPQPAGRDWSDTATLAVTRKEALYLQTRMWAGRCKGSLLGHFAQVIRANVETDYPWEAMARLPPDLDELVRHAEAFSHVMHGAAWIYNLALCRSSEREAHRERIEGYEAEIASWAGRDSKILDNWQPAELWDFLARRRVAIPDRRGDRRFVEEWVRRLRDCGPVSLASDAAARKLVERRELELKGFARSRFHNSRALDRWSGQSGTARMNYRWPRVRTLLHDLYEGLDRSPDQKGE